MWYSRPPPPFMAYTILNFHFDYLNPSLRLNSVSTSKFAFVLKKLRFRRVFLLHRAQPQYIDCMFDRLIEARRWWLATSPTMRRDSVCESRILGFV